MAEASNQYYQGTKSDHFDGERFFNPNGISPRSVASVLKWKFLGKSAKWPKSFESPFDDAKPAKRVEGERIVVTQIGHASQLIQTGGINIVTDPWWSTRASPIASIGPKRVNPPAIRFKNLPKIDLILLSHNHYDHMDIQTLKKLVKEHNPLIITPLGNDTIISRKIPQAEIMIGDWGDRLEVLDGLIIHFEPAHHWSARGTKDRRMALWAAFVIENGAKKIYHVGDTGFHNGINYREAAQKHGQFDVAILPIGAYEPRWFMQGQHQNPDEAVLGHIACKAKVSLGHHWATVQLTDEAIEAPQLALEEAIKKHGLEKHDFIAMLPGQAWDSA